MENKGNKSGNIYQKLKGAGAWQSKDSAGPMIKGVGIKSPLNMKKTPAKLATSAIVDAYKTQKQQKKNAETRKSGKAVSYKDAYADADKKKYKTYDAFEKAAKAYNTKKYGTTNPTADSKKAGKTKAQLAKDVADKNKKVTTTNEVPRVDKTGNTGGDKKVNKVDKANKNLVDAKNEVKNVKSDIKQTRKAKRIQKRADKKAEKAKRIKEQGGTKVGNFLRKTVKGAKDLVKKKSPAEMKKSPIKLNKIADKIAAGKKKNQTKPRTIEPDVKGKGAAKGKPMKPGKPKPKGYKADKYPTPKKKSPAKKALVGKQGNLPDHLVAKIKAAPGKMKYKK